MRRFLMATGGALALSAVALASPPAEKPAEDAKTEEAKPAIPKADEDCSKLEGDAKAACETRAKTAATETTEEAATEDVSAKPKGGKAKRSNTNRMEEEAADE